MYKSLLDAIDFLGRRFCNKNHPYFRVIDDPKTQLHEQDQIKRIFKRIRSRFPSTSSLVDPVSILLEDNAEIEVKELLTRIGLAPDLELLPEKLRNPFEANLPYAMLSHFYQNITADEQLCALLQLNLTIAGFQDLKRKLASINNSLHSNHMNDLKSFITTELTAIEKNIITKVISEIFDRQQIQHLIADFFLKQSIVSIKAATLPYHTLDREGLERLCFLILSSKGTIPRYFGKEGTKKDGIYFIVQNNQELIVYQCKNITSFDREELKKTLHDFEDILLQGKELSRTRKFVICCPLSLHESGQNEEWKTLEDQFYEKTGVKVQFWDSDYLNETLKYRPDIVAELFSVRAVELFCNVNDWNIDTFRPVIINSGEQIIKTYLEKKARGQIYTSQKVIELAGKLDLNGCVLIRGLPGSGKTIAAFALAEYFHEGQYRIFYVNMSYEVRESDLVEGIRRRLTRKTIFILDNCDGKSEMCENIYDRLARKIQDRAFLIFVSRTIPTPRGIPRGDYSEFESRLINEEASMELKTTLAEFQDILKVIKPSFSKLPRERVKKLYHVTMHDLCLLDYILEIINTPEEIDDLKIERLYNKIMKKYFKVETEHYPCFLSLTALTQFDIAPPVAHFSPDFYKENENAAKHLVTRAGRPVRYFFLHSSAAELFFRTLAWIHDYQDYSEKAKECLINFFINRPQQDPAMAADISKIIENRLKLMSKDEENRLKSSFLADDTIYGIIENHFTQFPLNIFAITLIILKKTDNNALSRYYNLIQRKIGNGKVFENGFMMSSLFLNVIKRYYTELFDSLYKQINSQRYCQILKEVGFMDFLTFISHLAETGGSRLLQFLDSVPDMEFNKMMERTIASGQSIGTINLALRDLKKSNPDLLNKLEQKIGARRWWQVICANGNITTLRNILRYMDRNYKRHFINSLQSISPTEWQKLLLQGTFINLCRIIRWGPYYLIKQWNKDILDILSPVFKTLIHREGWKGLDKGSLSLQFSPDSLIKNNIHHLLKEYLVTVNIPLLHFTTFSEAVYCVHVLWMECPSRHNELIDSLFDILPEEKLWYSDEQFIISARSLFFILAHPQVKRENVQRVIDMWCKEEAVSLLEKAETLDIFLYLWNFYTLWFEWEKTENSNFTSFMNSRIQNAVELKLKTGFQKRANKEETDNLITLTGFLSFIGLSVHLSASTLLSQLPPFNTLLQRIEGKTFIPGVFFLFGMEFIFHNKKRIPGHRWTSLLSKAEEYTVKLASLRKVSDIVRSKMRNTHGK